MRRHIFLTPLLAGLLLAGAWGHSTYSTGYACSVDPDYNPFEHVDAIVAGWVLDYEIERSADPSQRRHPVHFGLRTHEVFHGEVPGFLAIRDGAASWDDDLGQFTPAVCPGLTPSSVGRFVLVGLSFGGDGALAPPVAGVLYEGASPSDRAYLELLGRLEHPYRPANPAPLPPDVGSGFRVTTDPRGVPLWIGMGLSLAGAVAFAIARR